jgi:hypothetical protein
MGLAIEPQLPVPGGTQGLDLRRRHLGLDLGVPGGYQYQQGCAGRGQVADTRQSLPHQAVEGRADHRAGPLQFGRLQCQTRQFQLALQHGVLGFLDTQLVLAHMAVLSQDAELVELGLCQAQTVFSQFHPCRGLSGRDAVIGRIDARQLRAGPHRLAHPDRQCLDLSAHLGGQVCLVEGQYPGRCAEFRVHRQLRQGTCGPFVGRDKGGHEQQEVKQALHGGGNNRWRDWLWCSSITHWPEILQSCCAGPDPGGSCDQPVPNRQAQENQRRKAAAVSATMPRPASPCQLRG